MNRPGEDLRLAPGPGVPQGLVVPATDLVERFSRSSGPGGQSVNTSDSRVELVLDLAATAAFSDEQRARLLRVLGPDRLVGTSLVVTASEHRAQLRNRAAARRRLADLLSEALAPPAPPRRATRPTRGSQRRRLEGKRQRGRTKSLRGRVRDE
ncbi:MAG: alternative ribosome rescue aminoacyl-tRNA hydrolase ArfB [Nocardioides sp.]|nr:alternative ribosome rescue aminoacyl-tRNA hydrolase ArfB [Nocardioides sp.]